MRTEGHPGIPPLEHPLYALTTYELASRRTALERAIGEISPGDPVAESLRDALAKAIAEQDQRTRIRQASRRDATQDHHLRPAAGNRRA